MSRGSPIVFLLPTRATISGQRRHVFGGHILIPASLKTPIKCGSRLGTDAGLSGKVSWGRVQAENRQSERARGSHTSAILLQLLKYIDHAYVCDQRRNR